MLRWIAGLLSLVILAGAYFTYTQQNDLAEARAELAIAQKRAEAQLRINEMVRRHAAELEAKADSAEAVARKAVVRAQDADRALVSAQTAPDSLTAAIVARDAYRTAFHAQVEAAGALRARGDSLQAANEDLAGVVRDYGNAGEAMLDATKPSFVQNLIPDVGVGCTAGYDPTSNRLGTACGPTLTWSF